MFLRTTHWSCQRQQVFPGLPPWNTFIFYISGPKRLRLQTAAIFSIFHPVIAPRERRCRCRFIFRTHAPSALASMESRACVTRRNVCVESAADWPATPERSTALFAMFGHGPAFFVDVAKIKQECVERFASVWPSVCAGVYESVFEWMCVLTEAGRLDIHSVSLVGINETLQNPDIYI